MKSSESSFSWKKKNSEHKDRLIESARRRKKREEKGMEKNREPRNYGDTSKHTNIMEPSKGERRNILIAEKFSNIMKNRQTVHLKNLMKSV